MLTDNPTRLMMENDLFRMIFRKAVMSILLNIGELVLSSLYNSNASRVYREIRLETTKKAAVMYPIEQKRPRSVEK
jgi:hypothetical protein